MWLRIKTNHKSKTNHKLIQWEHFFCIKISREGEKNHLKLIANEEREESREREKMVLEWKFLI